MIEMLEMLVIVTGALSGVLVAAGRWVRANLRRPGRGLVVLALLALCAALGAGGYLDADAADRAPEAGLIAGIGLGVVPVFSYYALGLLARTPRIAFAVWLLSLVPAALYLGVTAFSLAVEQSCGAAAGQPCQW